MQRKCQWWGNGKGRCQLNEDHSGAHEFADPALAPAVTKDARRVLASMCESVMRCVLEIEGRHDSNGINLQTAGQLDEIAKKLRAAVLAAT